MYGGSDDERRTGAARRLSSVDPNGLLKAAFDRPLDGRGRGRYDVDHADVTPLADVLDEPSVLDDAAIEDILGNLPRVSPLTDPRA